MTTAAEDAPGAWAQVPAPPTGRRGVPPAVVEVVAVAVVAVGPALRTDFVASRTEALVVAVALAAVALATGRVPERAWPARLALVGLAGLAAYPGLRLGIVWAAVAALVADWAVRGRRPHPAVPAPPPTVLPGIAVVSAVLAWRGHDTFSNLTIAVGLAALLGLTVLAALAGERLAALVDRFAAFVGHLVARVGGIVVGIPLVLVPWVAHRIVGYDPLATPARPGTGWVDRSPGGVRSGEPWRADPAASGVGARRRAHGVLAAGATVALVAAVAVPVTIGVRDAGRPEVDAAHTNTDPGDVPAALRDDPWYPEYLQDISWLWQTGVAWDPLAPVRLRDVATRHITITDGARRSWQPPVCDCPRLTVWVYGGSTTFGLGQRDEHTTVSELARVAWDDGIALDVVNRGVVGDTHWEEAQRLAWDLATLEEPDLVVFVDGINDMQSLDRLQDRTRQPLSMVKADFWRAYLDVAPAGIDPRWVAGPDGGTGAPEGASVPPTVPVDAQTVDDWADLIADRYEAGRRVSGDIARGADVPVAWVWQPSIERRPAVDGEPEPAGRDHAEQILDGTLERLGDEVLDISHALDDLSGPTYWDQYHVDERGARVTAEALYRALRPQVDELTGGRP